MYKKSTANKEKIILSFKENGYAVYHYPHEKEHSVIKKAILYETLAEDVVLSNGRSKKRGDKVVFSKKGKLIENLFQEKIILWSNTYRRKLSIKQEQISEKLHLLKFNIKYHSIIQFIDKIWNLLRDKYYAWMFGVKQ